MLLFKGYGKWELLLGGAPELFSFQERC